MRAVEHPVGADEVMAYLDGELQRDRAAVVHAHVRDCPACQDVAARFRQLSHELNAWEVAPSPRFSAPVAREVPAPGTAAWWKTPRRWRLAAAVALIIVIAGTWLQLIQSPQLQRVLPEYYPKRTLSMSAEEPLSYAGTTQAAGASAQSARPGTAPQIILTASLTLVVTDFRSVRPAIDRILRETGGFIGKIEANDADERRTLNAVLRVPAARLDEAVTSLKGLGQAVTETQSGDDVTEQVRDLEARITNSRNTERRLVDVLKGRTARVSDVLEVEREIARVREEVERLEAQRLDLGRRVTYASLSVNVTQGQAAVDMGWLRLRSQLRAALVSGLWHAYWSVLDTALLLLSIAPALLLWAVILWLPGRALVRWIRAPRTASAAAPPPA